MSDTWSQKIAPESTRQLQSFANRCLAENFEMLRLTSDFETLHRCTCRKFSEVLARFNVSKFHKWFQNWALDGWFQIFLSDALFLNHMPDAAFRNQASDAIIWNQEPYIIFWTLPFIYQYDSGYVEVN